MQQRQSIKVECTCRTCGKVFFVLPGRVRQGRGIYCSRDCQLSHSEATAMERFWLHVDRSGGVDACWPWMGSRDKNGYGVLRIYRGKDVYTHRLSFFLANGRWPDPFGLHSCDNPPCSNPAHIFEGGNAENSADCVAKRRHNFGERNGLAKLNPEAVREIRARRDRHESTCAELAREFGVSEATVWVAATRKTWKHVD